MKEINSRPRALFPLMLCFFAMGFVDSVGVATHYIRADFQLSGTLSGLFATMVFLWFLAGAVPAGLLMNKIGRRKTVLWSLLLTAVAFVVPFAHYSFWGMFLSFAAPTTAATLSFPPIFPGFIRILSAPFSIAAIAIL